MLIDEFADDLLKDLGARAEALAPGHRLYLLIDGAFVPGLHRLLPSNEKALLFEHLAGCSEQARDASPFLVPFVRSNKTYAKLIKRCNRWPMLNVIETSESLDQLGSRLAAWCVVECDGQPFNFRFSDTRRLPGILDALNGRQRAQFAGPAVRWLYVSRDGCWREIDFSPSSSAIGSNPELSVLQFAALVDESRADEILALLSDLGCEVYCQASRSHALVNTAIQAALKVEIGSDDLIRWCKYFWTQDQLFESHTSALVFDNWHRANEAKNDQILLES